MYIIHDLEQKFLYRLGTCFHNTFILARFISFQAVWPRKKDQRDVGLDIPFKSILSDTAGTGWGPGVEGVTSLRRARGAGPGTAAPPSG